MAEGSRKQFVRLQALITEEQRAHLDADANARYPEEMTKNRRTDGTPIGRGLSPVLRDMIDFNRAHYPLFLQWIASRGNMPNEA